MTNRVKVNRRSRNVPVARENLGNKNTFYPSFDVKTTFTMGKLVPILAKETYPGDFWKIKTSVMLRFAPLYLPIMHRVNMSLDYIYVPNRVLWPTYADAHPSAFYGWEEFIFDFNSGLEHPVTTWTASDVNDGDYELFNYMGIPSKISAGAGAVGSVNAFFSSAYYAAWDQFYRNDQIQERMWIPLTQGNNPAYTQYTGANLTTFGCMFRNWNRDLWTTATYEAQMGSPVQIPLVMEDGFDIGGLFYDGPTRWRRQDTDATIGAGDLLTLATGVTNVTAIPVYLDIQETAGSIAQLRFALQMQEWLERGNRAGDRYSDRMDSYFGVDPTHGTIQLPVWLGSKQGRVVVSEVLSTTETATLKVGSYAGQAIALEESDTINYFCEEHGIILCIISVYPDTSYFQGIDRMWTRTLATDYAWEQFALIGDQAILNREVNMDVDNPPTDPDYNNSIFGYNRRYYELTYFNDIISGSMRDTFISFHLGRLLSVTDPELTVLDSDFITCRPDVTRVFQVTEGEDEIYAYINHDIELVRRLPKYGIPAL